MQTFSAVHLQHIRNAFAVLAEGIGKNTSIEKNGKLLELPFQFEINHSAQTPVVVEPSQTQTEEDITAKQLVNLVSKQEKTANGLQAIAVQLAQLTELSKQLKLDNDFFSSVLSKSNIAENVIVTNVEIVPKTLDSSSELSIEAAEPAQSCQSYFSRLPWSSEKFAEVAAKMREASPTVEVPQIIQLATESALKTAADTASLSEAYSGKQQGSLDAAEIHLDSPTQTSGDYFHALPWLTETAVSLSASDNESEQDSAIESLLSNAFASVAKEKLFQSDDLEVQLTFQSQTCADYFQNLPWATETEVELSAEYIDIEQNNAIDLLLSAEPELNNEALFEIFEPEFQPDLLPQMCGNYFQSLPWATEEDETQLSTKSLDAEQENAIELLFENDSAQAEEDFFQNLIQESEETPQPQDSSSYFQSLPWAAKKSAVNYDNTNQTIPDHPEQVQKRKAMLGAIFAKKAAVTDQDFLQMLEQETQISQPTTENKNFLQSLPWD
jgi:hypothetical protein